MSININYIILFDTKGSHNKINAKSDQNIHQDVPNRTFFLNFLAGEHGP